MPRLEPGAKVRTEGGAELTLGPEIGGGGRGSVYQDAGNPSRAAKVFYEPVSENVSQKLRASVALRCDELDEIASWPQERLVDASGQCIGYVMPRVSDGKEVAELFRPGDRKRSFPQADALFLLKVAHNIAFAAYLVHSKNCLIGDVHWQNILVLPDSTVVLIDTDSFQISHDGGTYLGEEGLGFYTASELQGKTFKDTLRTEHHDVFGVATLIFQLLTDGRMPFVGVPTDNKNRTVEQAIARKHYAYSKRGKSKLRPPEDAVDIRAFGKLAGLFERTFTSEKRPSALEWMQALRIAVEQAKRCSHDTHCLYLPGSPFCFSGKPTAASMAGSSVRSRPQRREPADGDRSRELLSAMKRWLKRQDEDQAMKGPDGRDVRELIRLANTFRSIGDLEEARALQEDVLEARRRVLGEEHPDTLDSMENLAATLLEQGERTRAIKLLQEMLDVCRRALADGSSGTLTEGHVVVIVEKVRMAMRSVSQVKGSAASKKGGTGDSRPKKKRCGKNRKHPRKPSRGSCPTHNDRADRHGHHSSSSPPATRHRGAR